MCRIPLNDDAREKAVRLQSRQALHDLQINQLKAAASPRRRLNPHERAASTSPKTPRSIAAGRGKGGDHGLAVVGGSALTPMKRVPILANFEEWMKMATDNVRNRHPLRTADFLADRFRKSTQRTLGTLR